MRWPVSQTGSQAEFERDWKIDTEFGHPESYGFHEALDINRKTGGDSDLGQPLYAVADGKIVYYHNNSHPTTNFGRHMVLECATSRGTRWYHYTHCLEITAAQKSVKEGEVIGKLGKSGTTLAHLHFAVFKTDPSELYKGIDSIASNKTNLNAWWEKFELLSSLSQEPMPTKTYTEDDMTKVRLERDANWSLYKDEEQKTKDALQDSETAKAEAKARKDDFESFSGLITQKLDLPSSADRNDILAAIERLLTAEDQVISFQRKLDQEQVENDKEVNKLLDELTKLKAANEALTVQINALEQKAQGMQDKKENLSLIDQLLNIFVKKG